MTTPNTTALTNLLNLIKGELEVELLPVAVGALQILQKTPNALGVEEAELYVMGNAPAALIQGEAALVQNELSDLEARLSTLQTAANATGATGVAPAKKP